MGEQTGIAWTDHTWSPWHGCTKVSPGCQHCYADALNHRWGHDNWGPGKPRRIVKDWGKPELYNRKARADGVRRKIFPSMCDPFDLEVPVRYFADLINLIERTESLDWLLLTKRPEAVQSRLLEIGRERLPENVWLGVSVENQIWANRRIPLLLSIPATVRFLSLEPLLGFIDLTGQSVGSLWIDQDYADLDLSGLGQIVANEGWPIHWAIIGGESGPGARAMEPEFVTSLLRQLARAQIKTFFKQTGTVLAKTMKLKHSKGEDPSEWPEEWRVQEFPA